jgi:hypothetical protein
MVAYDRRISRVDLPPSPWDSLSLAATEREGELAVMVEYCIRCGRQAPPVDSSA